MNSQFKVFLKYIILPVFITSVVITVIGLLSYNLKREDLKNEFIYDLDYRMLEGRDEIGALFRNKTDFSNGINNPPISIDTHTQFYPLKNIYLTDIIWSKACKVATTSFWGGVTFSNEWIINQLIKDCKNNESNQYFSFIDTFTPEIIVFKKDNHDKYTLYGEQIIAITTTSLTPSQYIEERVSKFTNNPEYYANISDFITETLNFISSSKYPNCKFHSIRYIEDGRNRNIKHEMLDSLQMSAYASGANSLYYRVNKYFELKPDDYYTYIGSHPIVGTTNKYTNGIYNIYYRTYETHYSVQENKDILKDEYLKTYKTIASIALTIVIIIGTIIAQKNKKI